MTMDHSSMDHSSPDTFYFQNENIFAVPILHYRMEFAAEVRRIYTELQPDCIAVELAETMQLQLLHAASRLPDISVVVSQNPNQSPLYYLVEPCDASFEALRSGLDSKIPCFCIDLDVDEYGDNHDPFPDSYSIYRIGLKNYYEAYQKKALASTVFSSKDRDREMHMARRLKELSLRYERILFIGGMSHVERVLKQIDNSSFPLIEHSKRDFIQLCTLTESSCRNVMAEFPYLTKKYEEARQSNLQPDRQKVIYELYQHSAEIYKKNTGNDFPGYHLRNIMKFVRNYALIGHQLLPDLFQILTSAKGCVDHNYAYETWNLASTYPFLRNIDHLPELDLSVEDIWGHSKIVHFHLKEKSRKNQFTQRRKDKTNLHFQPPEMFNICSYPPEDLAVERFGEFLKKKSLQLLSEDEARIIPFSTSIEEGIDTKETIRHWHEKKLYVKSKGKPVGEVGSIVIIFDEDPPKEKVDNEGNISNEEKYPWKTTWIGEHNQESDMALYATPVTRNVVGPGISRCEYGGFMMSYPPRRLHDIWSDPDYVDCQTKSEILLMAAIDYSIKPLITYVAAKPPRSFLKSFAKRFGKKLVYIPIGQLSPITLNKLRAFHVLDSQNKRSIAGEYIY